MDQKTQAYFQISIAGAKARKIIITLCTKELPITCKNFLKFCTAPGKAKRPIKSSSNTPLPSSSIPTYRNTEFHRIIPGFMIQGGDYQNFDGSGGQSFHGGIMKDESFAIPHDCEGVLSMANRGKDTNGSQFFITLAKTPHLDGKHVAFGHVTYGMDVIRDIAKVETEKGTGKPIMLERVVITDCGIHQDSEIDTNSRDGLGRHKHSKRTKKHRKHRKNKSKSKLENSSDSSIDGLENSTSDSSLSSRRIPREKLHKRKRKKKSRDDEKYKSRKRRRKRVEYSDDDDDDDDDSKLSSSSMYERKRHKKSEHRRNKKSRSKNK